jgi:hypothetical protein
VRNPAGKPVTVGTRGGALMATMNLAQMTPKPPSELLPRRTCRGQYRSPG